VFFSCFLGCFSFSDIGSSAVNSIKNQKQLKETPKGRRRFFFESDIYLADGHLAPNGVGRYFFFCCCFFEILFYGVFVRFSTRGVQKHHNLFWGKSMSKTFGRKS
jgi:hypothetical protein